jgi:type IV pilus assembly protein PilV
MRGQAMIRVREQRGFTLIELMAAVVILSIGLLGMMKMQMYAVQGNAFGGRMSTAIALAQDQMEALVNQTWNPWPAVTQQGNQSNPTLLGRQYQGYTTSWTMVPNTPVANVATLTVQCQWPGGNPITLVRYQRR